ncbi:hypothetical protein BJY00DRAFT_211533 [Aspergillus carlsbadensis]|nr:hypothetical protein BJY00DRAFT_211533 [Aspergillus carlsbadensis]
MKPPKKWDWQTFYHHGSAALAQAPNSLPAFLLALQGDRRPLFSHLILIASSVKHFVTSPSKGASEKVHTARVVIINRNLTFRKSQSTTRIRLFFSSSTGAIFIRLAAERTQKLPSLACLVVSSRNQRALKSNPSRFPPKWLRSIIHAGALSAS